MADPTQLSTWPVFPGSSPTVVIGKTEIDFRLLPLPQEVFSGYYIFNTQTSSETLRDDDRSNWISTAQYSSIALDVSGTADVEMITVTPANNLRCIGRDGSDVWNKLYGTLDQLGCPALYDIDGDTQFEVILGLYDQNGPDMLKIINAEDGTEQMSVQLTTGKANVFSAPVIGDVDNDGDMEIICYGSYNRRVYSISVSGTIEWQKTLPDYSNSPIMGDFDADGEMEVAAITEGGIVYYLSGIDGTTKDSVSTGLTVVGSPIAGDVNNDGFLEIIASGTRGSVIAIGWQGNIAEEWVTNMPSGTSRSSTPAMADTDGNGIPDIITVGNSIRVLYWGGTQWTKTPGTTWTDNGNSPVVFDANSDGLLDIVYLISKTDGSSTRLYRASTTTSSSSQTWPTLKGDFRRSGVYGSDLYGDDPDLAIDNHNWSYGNVSAGSNPYKDFTITNYGTQTLTGNCQNSAKITIDDTTTFNIAPGASKTFRATFDTSEQGIHEGYVIVANLNDPDEPRLYITATANITQPEHDIAVYAIHVGDQLNPNYVNVPPIEVEFRNLGAYWEGGVTTNMTIDGILATPITASTFDLDPGEARNVIFYWDRTNPSLDGEGVFTLEAAAQNTNLSIEGDATNNRLSKNVDVSYPVEVTSVTSWLAQNLTYYTSTTTFTEGDNMRLKVVVSNEWSSTVDLVAIVNVYDVTGSPQRTYGGALDISLSGGEQVTQYIGWWLSEDVSTDTKYNATVTVYDKLGGGTRILADPYVHSFWVESN